MKFLAEPMQHYTSDGLAHTRTHRDTYTQFEYTV